MSVREMPDFLARPKRFELLTPRFVVWRSVRRSARVDHSMLKHAQTAVREQSGSATIPGARRALGILPRRLHGRGGAVVVAANDAAPTHWRIPMARPSATQLGMPSAGSRSDDGEVGLPANVTGEALRKAVDKLSRTGLLEEVRANGSLLAWRRDAEAGPMALRITKQGLEAIGVTDVAVGAPTGTGVSPAPDRTEVEAPAVKVVASRKRASVATQTSVRTRHRTSKAKTKAGSSRESRPGSKQARVLGMLCRPEGATIADLMRA